MKRPARISLPGESSFHMFQTRVKDSTRTEIQRIRRSGHWIGTEPGALRFDVEFPHTHRISFQWIARDQHHAPVKIRQYGLDTAVDATDAAVQRASLDTEKQRHTFYLVVPIPDLYVAWYCWCAPRSDGFRVMADGPTYGVRFVPMDQWMREAPEPLAIPDRRQVSPIEDEVPPGCCMCPRLFC